MVLDESGSVERRLAHYLAVTRWLRLEVGGRDLVALGFQSGPRLGDVLRTLLRMKVSGMLPNRESELEAARRLL